MIGVVPNHQDSVTTLRNPAIDDRLFDSRDTALGLLLELPRVIADHHIRIFELPPQPGSRPQLADPHLRKKISETTAMILISMREDEHRQVRHAIDDGQHLRESINDSDLRRIVIIRLQQIMNINLDHDLVITTTVVLSP